jgi:hypothetical protein
VNPLRRAHNKFVKIITWPCYVGTRRQERRARHHLNVTCVVKGHTFFVDFGAQTQKCTRCGRLEKLDEY